MTVLFVVAVILGVLGAATLGVAGDSVRGRVLARVAWGLIGACVLVFVVFFVWAVALAAV
jgi:hypothetical protein